MLLVLLSKPIVSSLKVEIIAKTSELLFVSQVITEFAKFIAGENVN